MVVAGIAATAGTVLAQQPAPPANPRRPAPAATAPAPAPAPAPLAAPVMPAMAQLPNGATSINETYGDWTVDCRIIEGRKACAFSQSQGNQQTGQRSFAIEFRLPENGKTDGVLLLPFGLNLDLGVKLKIDEQDLGQGVRFSTCLPSGCLAPISLPTVATEALKKGTRLIVSATSLSSGEAATFNVSLNGFAAAIARVAQLGG
ncbi:MAG: invasion associated locus B family protein [Rhizobiales bacterium]|nr:invasion associated locus B family protein [Hyphomicrobiales bacterium]